MASTSSVVGRTFTLHCARRDHPSPPNSQLTKLSPAVIPGRRQLLLLTTATTAFKAVELPSRADDIGLFGLRKKLKKAEEQAEELVKESFEAADKGIEAAGKGIEAAEKGLETAEKGLEAAEKEIEETVSFGALAQAGAVAGAEFVGVLVATSIVNGILGPEAQKS
ncbi:OLC1v1010016C1 [Oldenlandia corymbosa var. corymbosa]|uniref:OLC1v1010016C1 n=1 Tax=Oldenlandia corymbosa var. corymbosa TaxID=529605 RepID=A0AAV1DT98_OLDCO|nr:OLC1v1010016C1 [Oldenlandia corymbosa var. corymbosa]